MWPFHYGPEPGVNIKTNNWSVDNLKKHVTMSCTLEPMIQSGDTGQQIHLFTAVN